MGSLCMIHVEIRIFIGPHVHSIESFFCILTCLFQDGAQFAKWRCVHKIGATTPSHMALVEIAEVTIFRIIRNIYKGRS